MSINVYISDFGGYMNAENDTYSALQNGIAFYDAIMSTNPYDIVILQENETIYYIPNSNEENNASIIYGIQNITIQLNGLMILHDNISAWSMQSDGKYSNAIDIRNSDGITIRGNGTINGQGILWWWEFLIGVIPRQRPTMIQVQDTSNILIEELTMLDSPRFNVYCDNILNLEVRYMTIWINTYKQMELQKKHIYTNRINKTNSSKLPPMFPFNTDGIDFSGKNILIHNNNISNYDDTIAVKPTHSGAKPIGFDNIIVNCTENVLVRDMDIFRGVGLSIGSVPSKLNYCVRNVLFENINAYQPLKFIYIKTGSIDNATDIEGTIENIMYRNMTANGTILWAIYLGGQQQQEPDGTGDGFFPIPQANPYVSIRNITFENIHIINANYYAGVLMCNISNPCTEINIQNVSIIERDKFSQDGGYLCSDKGSLYGSYDNISSPTLSNCIIN
jgi:polygalacturonase